ncbi:hypothetical protein PVK06_027817 [Gossypium arboreum]|uniref:Retrotransposon gag domain-containing protein n=1 Tax=Gossypium arboreum TaxID=29729 RepID=A0ABR0P1K2_GOSAR|nr:hypothetical protein PVK06_027817 [Gossypium arboreum]
MIGRDLSNRLQSYIAEINGLEEKSLTSDGGRRQRWEERKARVAIYSNVAFDGKYSRLASGLVVWREMGEFLASKIVLNFTTSSSFMAEAHAGLQAVKTDASVHVPSKVIFSSCAKEAALYASFLGYDSVWGFEEQELMQIQFFPASRAARLRKEIVGIRQKESESLYDYWELFKMLCASCPQHGITEQSLLQFFYEGLNPIQMNMVDAASGGALVNMTPQ